MNMLSFGRQNLAGLGLAMATFLAGCDAPRPDTPATVLRDSVGVRISVTQAGTLNHRVFGSVDATPLFQIGGGVEGAEEQLLFRVKGARFLNDSVLAVLNAGTGELRLYDDRGEFLKATPGFGEGPGEFVEPTGLSALGGDTIAVWDAATGESTVFGDGEYLDMTRVNIGALSSHWPGLFQMLPEYRWAQVGPDRVLLFFYPIREHSPDEGLFRIELGLILTSFEGTQADTLGWFRSIEQMRLSVAGGRSVVEAIEARNTYHAVSEATGHIYVGDSEQFSVSRYTLDGRLDMRIEVEGGTVPMSEGAVADGREALEELLGQWGYSSGPAVAANAPVRATAPAFSGLVADAEGRLWVKRTASDTSSAFRYAVFGTNGAFEGSITLPAHDRILTMRGNRVVLLRTDDLGVEQIAVYEMTRHQGAYKRCSRSLALP